MTIQELKSKCADFLVFTKDALRAIEPRGYALDANIKYWLASGDLVALKKGFYLLRDRYDRESNKDRYLEYVAGQLVKPSYLSVEYVLAKYQILSEPVQAITSATTKTSNEISNDLSTFRYYSLSKKLFCGYTTKYFYDAPVFEATKSKALFDFLYLRFLKDAPINVRSIENLRLNWENVSKKEFSKAMSYLALINSIRLKEVFSIIKNNYYA